MNPQRWVSDATGRFAKRPHYSPEQLDSECERVVNDFLADQHRRIEFPISTDDLTILLEQAVEDVDLYTDFSSDEGEIEGVTEFRRGRRPVVRIAARLTNTAALENRLRTTLTHEYAHVHFHDVLYQVDSKPAFLFGDLNTAAAAAQAHRCKRDSMITLNDRDWMEWQAGYVCGAMLIPLTALVRCVQRFRSDHRAEHALISEESTLGAGLIQTVAQTFQTSRDAARVRLLQKKFLTSGQWASLL